MNKKTQDSLKIFLFNMLVTWKWLWFIEFVRFQTGVSENDVVKLAYCMTPRPLSAVQSNMINASFKWPIQSVCIQELKYHKSCEGECEMEGEYVEKTQQHRMTKWKVEQQ